MKCMCAQTRPRFILSSEGVLGGMEFEPMLTPREKSPLPESVPRGGSNPRHCGQRAQALPTELFRPQALIIIIIIIIIMREEETETDRHNAASLTSTLDKSSPQHHEPLSLLIDPNCYPAAHFCNIVIINSK